MSQPPDNDPAEPGQPPAAEPTEERIGRAVRRLEDAVARKPGFGRSTNISQTVLTGGVRCESQEGDHRIVTDLAAALGGDGSGPTPGALLRAALGSCLAMGYRLRAARHGIPIDSIQVEVETDSAVGGMLDPDSAFPPGYIEIRYRVAIESPAPAEQIEQIIEEGDQLSPVLDAVVRANRVTRVEAAPPSTATATAATTGGER